VSYPEWSRRVAALAQFRVADPETPYLSGADEHHLRTVLRAKSGEEIVVTNGKGSWSICEVRDIGVTRVTPVHLDPATTPTTLYMAPLKGDRSEWAVAKATELGVHYIVPLVSQRVVVKFKGEPREKVLARWRRIAAESSGQCRRSYDIFIEEPVNVTEVPLDVCVCEFGGQGDWSNVAAVAIGPEGGWAPDEWPSENRRLGLGPNVLRAETASVVAASLLAFGNGDWGFTLHGQGTQ
jgi:16S rRNA (uracil1498-N3)-methyltransferase